MTTKEQAQSKLSAAAKACEVAVQEWRAAVAALDGSVGMNGLGILHDRNQLRNKLWDAQQHIERSLAELGKVDWPTGRDYDLAE